MRPIAPTPSPTMWGDDGTRRWDLMALQTSLRSADGLLVSTEGHRTSPPLAGKYSSALSSLFSNVAAAVAWFFLPGLPCVLSLDLANGGHDEGTKRVRGGDRFPQMRRS